MKGEIIMIKEITQSLLRPQHIVNADNLKCLSEEQLKSLYAEYESILNEDDRTGYLTDSEYAEACYKIKEIEKILLNRQIKQLEKEHEEEIKELIRLRRKGGGTVSNMSIHHKKDNDGMEL